MKSNEKGFAITSFMYVILMMFLVIFSALIMQLINSQLTLQKMKNDIKNKIENNILVQDNNYITLTINPKNIQINSGESINLLDGVYLEKYDGTKIDNDITYKSNPEFNNNITGNYTITYSTTYNNVFYTDTRNIIVN